MSQRIVENNQNPKVPPKERPCSPRKDLPAMYDLPSEEIEESGLPDEFHLFQSHLLRETFQPSNYPSDEIFVGTDIYLYFDENHTRWYKRPDWFASVGVPRLYGGKDLRLSYVVWQEQVNPLLVIEILSPGTENEDLGQSTKDDKDIPTKWVIYEKILKVPFYFTYDHLTQQINAFRLEGDNYISFLPDKDSRFSLPNIGLSLGLWQGSYQNINKTWLRWFDEQCYVIPTPLEKKIKGNQQLDQNNQQLAQEKELLSDKVQRLAAKLKELGIDPEKL